MNKIKLFLILAISIVLISYCSEKAKRNSQKKHNETKTPSISMKFLAKYNFYEDDSLLIFKLIPTSKPSGNISLMSVQNGKTKILQDLKFQDMEKPGTIAIKRTKQSINLGYDLKCSMVSFSKKKIIIPKNAKIYITSYDLSNSFNLSSGFNRVFWYITYFMGKEPLDLITSDNLKVILESSKKNPSVIFYMLAIKPLQKNN